MNDDGQRNREDINVSRAADAAIGLLFVAISVAIVIFSEFALPVLAAALVVGGLGLEALVSACRKRRSLLSRIGPLP